MRNERLLFGQRPGCGRILVTLLCWGGCLTGAAGCGGDDSSPADVGGNGGDGVAAGDFASLAGVGSYGLEVTLDTAVFATIEVLARSGGELGTVTLAPDGDGGLLAAYSGHTGATASLSLDARASDTGDRIAFEETLTVGERSLTVLSVADRETGASLDVWLETLLPEGQTASALGGASLRGDGTWAVLTLIEDDQPVVSEAIYGQWLADMGLGLLMASPEATLVGSVLHDEALVGALLSELDALAPEEQSAEKFLGRTLSCSALREVIRDENAAAVPACQQCAEIDPAPTSPYPVGFDNPNAQRIYQQPCTRCADRLNLSLIAAAACVHQWTGTRRTLDQCGPRAAGTVWSLDESDRCVLSCDPAFCDQACSSQWTDELGGECTLDPAGRAECSCLELRGVVALCGEVYGTAWCGEGSVETTTDPATDSSYRSIACVTAECGDGVVNGSCPQRVAETCDPNAPQQGCGADRMRCVDCFQFCEPCQCDPQAQDCPASQRCDHNCQCVDSSGCRFSLMVDLLSTSTDAYCDPLVSTPGTGANGLCARNQTCNATSCTCEGGEEVTNFAGSWDGATCPTGPPRWSVGLQQDGPSVTGTISFHRCPGGGRAAYAVSGTAGSGPSITLTGTRTSAQGDPGGLADTTPIETTFSFTPPGPPSPNYAP